MYHICILVFPLNDPADRRGTHPGVIHYEFYSVYKVTDRRVINGLVFTIVEITHAYCIGTIYTSLLLTEYCDKIVLLSLQEHIPIRFLFVTVWHDFTPIISCRIKFLQSKKYVHVEDLQRCPVIYYL